jgi:Cupin-like domain
LKGNDYQVDVGGEQCSIKEIVDWKGQGEERQYKVRYRKSPKKAGQVPIEKVVWVNPWKLSALALVHAHELVQQGNRKGGKEGRKDDHLPHFASKNRVVKKNCKPSAKRGLKLSTKQRKLSMISTKPRGTKTRSTAAFPVVKEIKSETNSEVEFVGTIANVGTPNLNQPFSEQHRTPPERLKRFGSNVMWVDEARPGAGPFADQNLFRRFVPEITTEREDKCLGNKRQRLSRNDSSSDMANFRGETQLVCSNPRSTELVCFQAVERVDFNHEMARDRISEMRRYGIPFVITGHSNWPAFASRWVEDDGDTYPTKLVIEKLITDIGNEDVPIVEKNYDERNPVKSVMKAAAFIKDHWTKNNDGSRKQRSDGDQIYMQQWQFTSSPVAEILCGDDDCKPPDVLHEDLVSHWLKDSGNPYQYLFMGSSGTMSKLHKDPGGLDILIAPIVGEKECVLVHRDDDKYLYGCRAKLDKIDLNRFPLIACARIWKTVVKAGEILVLPHDTYHQCRNVTSCLSYHRLHLDCVNLPGFLASFFQKDSGESIEHEEIIWNCVQNLCEMVDEYVKDFRKQEDDPSTTSDRGASIEEYLLALRSLRPICMQLTRPNDEFGSVSSLRFAKGKWKDHIRRIDSTLFHHQHRNDEKPPRFRSFTLQGDVDSDESSDEQEEKLEYRGKWTLVAKLENLLDAMKRLPSCNQHDEGLVISDAVSIELRSRVQVRLPEVNRYATGVVKSIREMEALFVSYNELPTEFDEFLPVSEVKASASSAVLSVASTALRPAIWGNQNSQQEVRCIPSSGPKKVSARVPLGWGLIYCRYLVDTCISH